MIDDRARVEIVDLDATFDVEFVRGPSDHQSSQRVRTSLMHLRLHHVPKNFLVFKDAKPTKSLIARHLSPLVIKKFFYSSVNTSQNPSHFRLVIYCFGI